MAKQSKLDTFQKNDTPNAIVFVHGFWGDPAETWGRFPEFLMEDRVLDGWDIFSLGYSTRLAPDFRGIWSGDPAVEQIAELLKTNAEMGELETYKALAFVAHSMGGLVVQRALLNGKSLRKRTSHVFLFGTPSNGLKKAGWGKWLKRQAGDMDHDGDFINQLREDWQQTWPDNPPPKFWAIAGDKDEFVPASTSLGPFPNEQRLVVPGNHLEIVKPKSNDNLSVRVVVRGIQGEAAPAGPMNAASVALQMLDFRDVVARLEPHADELDPAHSVELALALDGLGKSERALEIMEKVKEPGTDAKGVLAGRLKRRWIAEGRASDYDRALSLYESGFEESSSTGDHSQVFYHGINVCFMLTARERKEEAADMARKVVKHCGLATREFWCLGTQGEARLYLNDVSSAMLNYREAVAVTPQPEPWMLKSMHSQACQLTLFLKLDENHRDLVTQLDQIFLQTE